MGGFTHVRYSQIGQGTRHMRHYGSFGSSSLIMGLVIQRVVIGPDGRKEPLEAVGGSRAALGR